MASHSQSPPSPSNSPPASLLIETIDYRTGDAVAQSVDQPSRSPPSAVSLLASSSSERLDHIDIPYGFDALALSVAEPPHDLPRAASPATTDHTITPHNFAELRSLQAASRLRALLLLFSFLRSLIALKFLITQAYLRSQPTTRDLAIFLQAFLLLSPTTRSGTLLEFSIPFTFACESGATPAATST